MSRPAPSSLEASERLKKAPRSDTGPELALRRELHRRGLRFVVGRPPLSTEKRRRADVVFTRVRVAVLVDGCFWHGCPDHMTWPKANAEWWRAKIEANVARDRRTDADLCEAGWTVVRVWEHEDPHEAADRVEAAVRDARARQRRNASSSSSVSTPT